MVESHLFSTAESVTLGGGEYFVSASLLHPLHYCQTLTAPLNLNAGRVPVFDVCVLTNQIEAEVACCSCSL